MYEINKDQTVTTNFLAGDFPIVTATEFVKSGTTVKKHAPIVKTADGISEVTSENVADLYGIAADDSADGSVICYLTGEYFSDSLELPLELPQDVTIETLKPIFRKLGIFLR